MGQGYIKIYRQITDCWIWDRDDYLKAWIDLLFMANYKDKKTIKDGKIVTFAKGTVTTSIYILADRWGWDRKKVRRFLEVLETDKMVSLNRTTRGTIISIVNYEVFQDEGTANGTTVSPTSSPTVSPTPSPLLKKGNKGKKGNNIDTPSEYLVQSDVTPYQKIVDLFNEICVSLPKVREITATRRRSINARWKAYKSLDKFRKLFEMVEESKFLRGVSGTWHASFDWLMNESNATKVLEGNYVDREDVEKPKDEVSKQFDVISDWLAGKEKK